MLPTSVLPSKWPLIAARVALRSAIKSLHRFVHCKRPLPFACLLAFSTCSSKTSSHVVVSGFCEVGENCFLGVNSCVADRVKIARDCIIGAGAVVIKDTEEGKVYVGNPARPLTKSSFETFDVEIGEH